MSIFKKLFGKRENQIDESKFETKTKLDFKTLDELIEHHVIIPDLLGQ